MVRHLVPLAVLCASLPVRAQDGGASTEDAGVSLEPTVLLISASTAGVPCASPCREVTARPAQPVQLHGLATGPGADAVSLFWEVAYRPAGSATAIPSPREAQVTLTPDVEGVYDINLVGERPGDAPLVARLTLRVRTQALTASLVILEDGSTLVCTPDCPADRILIGTLVTADGTATSHDPSHGALQFSWTLHAPPGSTAQLVGEEEGKVSFRPDVDGAWEIVMTAKDDRDTVDASASFIIPTPLNWKPLDGCQDARSSAGGSVAVLLLWFAFRGRRRPVR